MIQKRNYETRSESRKKRKSSPLDQGEPQVEEELAPACEVVVPLPCHSVSHYLRQTALSATTPDSTTRKKERRQPPRLYKTKAKTKTSTSIQSNRSKRSWTKEMDEKLIAALKQTIREDPKAAVDYCSWILGPNNTEGKFYKPAWSEVAKTANTGRNGKACRERWVSHLAPWINKTPFSADDDKFILAEYNSTKSESSVFARIGKALGNRCPNDVRLRFLKLQKERQREAKKREAFENERLLKALSLPSSATKPKPESKPKPKLEPQQAVNMNACAGSSCSSQSQVPPTDLKELQEAPTTRDSLSAAADNVSVNKIEPGILDDAELELLIPFTFLSKKEQNHLGSMPSTPWLEEFPDDNPSSPRNLKQFEWI